MAAIYHAGVVQVVPQYDLGQPTHAANVTYWKTTVTGLTLTQLAAIRDAFDAIWDVNWRLVGAPTVNYVGSIVTDMSSNTGASANNAAYVPHAGTATGGQLGDQVAGLISLKGGIRYRGGHSRLYIPGAAGGMVNNDGRTLTAGAMTNLVQLYTRTVTAMAGVSTANGGPLTPIIWHKKWSASPNSIEDVFNVIASPILATQRRRLRKVSRHRTRTP